MKRLLFLAAAVFLVPGCSSGPDKPEAGDWQQGDEAFLAGRWDAAIAAYRRFVQSNPRDSQVPLAHLRIGRAYLAQGQPGSALPEFDLALEGDGSDAVEAEAHAARGIAYHGLGSPAKAELEFTAALRTGGKRVRRDEALFYLGVSKIRQGRWDEGLADLHTVTREHADSEFAARARAVRSAPERSFAIQVGAFSDPAGARRRCDELKAKGYEPVIVPQEDLQCVRVGRYTSWREAQAAADGVKDKTGLETVVVP
jgi:tetratricopeptide (TPR) repeat protein